MCDLQRILVLICGYLILQVSGSSIGEPGRNCSSGSICLKLELLRLAGRLGNATSVPVGPGMILMSTDRTRTMMERLQPLATSPLPVQAFLGAVIGDFLGSLNLTVQLRDSSLLGQVKSFGLQLWNSSSSIGRRYKYKYRSSWYAVATIAAIGLALLASLCGKALMASMLALALSAIVALRAAGFAAPGFASPARVTQYEIISKPSYATAPATQYYDHEHHHHVPGSYSYGKRDMEGSKID